MQKLTATNLADKEKIVVLKGRAKRQIASRLRRKRERLKRAKETACQQIETSRKAYAAACAKRLNDRLIVVQSQVKDSEQKLGEASRTIVCENRNLDDLRPEIGRLTEKMEGIAERSLGQFDSLLSLPHVKNVSVNPEGVISVFTDTVFLRYNGKRYELGDYKIDFYPDGALNISNLRVQKLTTQSFYHHPHVFNNGGTYHQVCLGNLREGVYQLIASQDYYTATEILVDFLHQMKDAHPYTPYLVNNWKPIPPRKRKLKTRTKSNSSKGQGVETK